MQLSIKLPDSLESFHAVNTGMWTVSAGAKEADGNAYVERAEGGNLDEVLAELSTKLATHH